MAEAHAKNHDFHILDPSPWPLIGAFSRLPDGVRRRVLDEEPRRSARLTPGPYIFGAGIARRALHDVLAGGRTWSTRPTTATTPASCSSITATA